MTGSSRSDSAIMMWRDAAERIDAGIATMLVCVTDGSVATAEALKAAKQAAADMAEMVALVDIERTPTEELHEIMRTCKAFSAKLTEFEERAEAILAVIEHQGEDDAAVA